MASFVVVVPVFQLMFGMLKSPHKKLIKVSFAAHSHDYPSEMNITGTLPPLLLMAKS